ncbi:MAG: outer membrane protein OmpA-like peptidoglycan-associated protein [Parvicella sp.]|jgi:outer membrane protein OmpA-like peptidoglycan-associated protein/protocatechuate 3,4-dioxygenase beta subunit
MVKFIKILSVFIFITSGVCAQGDIGDALFDNFEYKTAITYYENAEDLSLNQKENLAYCYFVIHDYEKAVTAYQPIIEKNEDLEAIFYYFYGASLKNTAKYDDARIWLAKAMETDSSNYIKQSLASLEILETLNAAPPTKEIVPLPTINNGMSTYSPIWYKDGILYCSELKSDSLKRRPTIDIKEGFEDFASLTYGMAERPLSEVFYAEVDADGAITKTSIFAKNDKFHIGTFYIKDESDIYFTKIDLTNKWDPNTRNHPRIYKGKVDETLHTVIESDKVKIKKLSNEVGAGHPYLSSDGNTMYFSSDRPGGYGGSDLYKTTWTDEKWSEPINLGKGINTAGDELYPSIYNENILHFASDGRPGFGGLDIFSSEINGDSFSAPKLLAAPINSSGDDFGLIINSADTNQGFFTSNRYGGQGDDDIYRYKLKEPDLLVQGTVKDVDGNPVADVVVRLFDEDGNEVGQVRTDENGHYEIEATDQGTYSIESSTPGYGARKEVLLDNSYTSNDATDLNLEPMATAQGEVTNPDGTPAAHTQIDLKDSDGNIIQSAITDENGNYTFLLEEDKTYTAEATQGDLSGSKTFTTDDAYDSLADKDIQLGKGDTFVEGIVRNQDGTPAAGATVQLFDEDGNLVAETTTDENGNYRFDLDKNKNYQIIAMTDGFEAIANIFTGDKWNENDKLDLNLTPAGIKSFATVTDNKTGKPLAGAKIVAENKKTGMKVTAITDENGLFALSLQNNADYTLNITKDGYYPKTLSVNIGKGKLDEIDLSAKDDYGLDYAGYNVDKIYYEMDQSKLTQRSITQLEKIVGVLKENPNATITIRSYADCRGRDTYNLSLSWKRSRTVKQYLISNGIKSGRVITESLGATNFENNCITEDVCSEEEHSLNRRSEFEIDFGK